MILILFFKTTFRLLYSKSIVSSEMIKIDEKKYFLDSTSKSNNGFIGFFDWLRVSEDIIAGIRMCYFKDLVYGNILRKLPYIKSTFDNRCMEMLFGKDDYDPMLSGDQDFTNNYVYISDDGTYLFTFSLDHLTKKEFDSLIKECELIDQKPN